MNNLALKCIDTIRILAEHFPVKICQFYRKENVFHSSGPDEAYTIKYSNLRKRSISPHLIQFYLILRFAPFRWADAGLGWAGLCACSARVYLAAFQPLRCTFILFIFSLSNYIIIVQIASELNVQHFSSALFDEPPPLLELLK